MAKNRKKQAALTAAAAAAAAGVMLGSAFADPVDLLQDGPQPLSSAADASDDGGEDEELRGVKRLRAQARGGVREAVLSLPAWVRAAVAFPLWCLGWALLQLGSLAWPLLSPVLALAGKWLLTGLVLLGILALSAKLACPELPLREVFRLRNLGFLLLLLGFFGGADAVLSLLWEDHPRFSPILHLLGGGLTLALPLVLLLRRHRRAERAAEPRETEEQRVRRVARELADTVCPPRYY